MHRSYSKRLGLDALGCRGIGSKVLILSLRGCNARVEIFMRGIVPCFGVGNSLADPQSPMRLLPTPWDSVSLSILTTYLGVSSQLVRHCDDAHCIWLQAPQLLLRHPVMAPELRPFVLRRIPCTGVSNKSHSSGAFFYLVGAIYPTPICEFFFN